MRLLTNLLFLTFVLTPLFSLAAPQTTTTVDPTPYEGADDPSLVATHPDLRTEPTTFYLNVSAGYQGGNFLERDEYQQSGFASVRYMPLQNDQLIWDYQLAYHFEKESFMNLALGRRWYCCPGDSFMPYARASANLIINPKDELAGLAEIRRWRLRAGLGLGESFVWEFGVGLAVTGTDLYAQFGYNFPF